MIGFNVCPFTTEILLIENYNIVGQSILTKHSQNAVFYLSFYFFMVNILYLYQIFAMPQLRCYIYTNNHYIPLGDHQL